MRMQGPGRLVFRPAAAVLLSRPVMRDTPERDLRGSKTLDSMKLTARLLTCGLGAGALLTLAMAAPAAAEAPPIPTLKPALSAPATALATSLDFAPAATDLDSSDRLALSEVAAQMRAAPDGQLSITAYAIAPNGDEALARRLALDRAVAVRRFMIEQGVPGTRLAVRALGRPSGAGTADRVDLRLPAQ